MFDELSKIKIPDFVLINPETSEKRRFHGSLFGGIYSNMLLAIKNYRFDFFIILSSRTLFYRKMTVEDLKRRITVCGDIQAFRKEEETPKKIVTNSIFFYRSKLGSYYTSKKQNLFKRQHEGQTCTYNVCKNVINFLNTHEEFYLEMLNVNFAAEEFVIPTVAYNEIDISNGEHKTFCICGSIGGENGGISPNDLFLRKVTRKEPL
jgi:hypothetical protein